MGVGSLLSGDRYFRDTLVGKMFDVTFGGSLPSEVYGNLIVNLKKNATSTPCRITASVEGRAEHVSRFRAVFTSLFAITPSGDNGSVFGTEVNANGVRETMNSVNKEV